MTTFDRLVEDPGFYVRVQKLKLLIVLIGLNWIAWFGLPADPGGLWPGALTWLR